MGSMKSVFGAAAVGVLGVLALAPSAAARVTPPPVPGETGFVNTPPACVFTVDPASSTTFPVVVTVAGSMTPVPAPASTVTLYLDGVAQPTKTTDAAGKFSFTGVTIPLSTTAITVNYTYGNKNAYTAICAGVLGETVIRVKAEAVALAFTGSSSNTPTYVLFGFAAVVLGLVMVVGVRRRASVRG